MPANLALLLPAPKPSPLPPPPLPVLIRAQQIARQRGQKLDIQSLMAPDILEQYRVKHLGLPPSVVASKDGGDKGGGEKEVEPEEENEQEGETEGEQKVVVTSPPVTTTATTTTTDALIASAPAPGTPSDAGTSTPLSSPAIPRRIKIPDLSHLHWKQRQKRLAEIAREQELLEQGIVPEVSVMDDIPPPPKPKGEKQLTPRERQSIKESASYWNSLLVHARKARGPQWDFSTQQHLYDRSSKEYYTHGHSPPPSPPRTRRKLSEAGPSSAGVNGSVKSESAGFEGPAFAPPQLTPSPAIAAPSLPAVTSHSPYARPTSRGNSYSQSTPSSTPQHIQPSIEQQTKPSSLNIPAGAQGMNPAFLASLQSLTPSQLSALQSSGLGAAASQSMAANGMTIGPNGMIMRGPGSGFSTMGQQQQQQQQQQLNGMPGMTGQHSANQGLNSMLGLQGPGMQGVGVMGPPGGSSGGQGPMLSGGWQERSKHV